MSLDPTRTWESKVIRHTRQLLTCRVSPCGNYVFAGGFDAAVQRWHLDSDRRTALPGHRSWVQSLTFHPDGRRLLTADYRGQVHCWRYAEEEPRPLWTIPAAHRGWIRATAVSPDGRLLATAGNDCSVRLWSPEDGRPVRELSGHETHVYNLAFHRDGGLVSGDLTGVVEHWDVGSGRLVRELNAGALWTPPGPSNSLTGIGGIRAFAFDADGTQLACAGVTESDSATFAVGKALVVVFDWGTGSLVQRLRPSQAFDGFVTGLVFHPSGLWIGSGGGQGGTLWFWRPGQAEPFFTLPRVQHIRDLHLHPDGLRLAAAAFAPNGQGGNGRHVREGEYVDNVGVVRFYSMTAQPAPASRPRNTR